MQLSLTQAAQLLGKTRRQVEYQIRQGRLKAEKVGGQWRIDEDALGLSPGQRQAMRRRADALRDAALGVLDAEAPRPAYSMTDLYAFQVTRALRSDAREPLDPDHPALAELERALRELAIGCHRYERQDKTRAYQAARDALSLAACALHLDPDPQRQPLARRIEGCQVDSVAAHLNRKCRRWTTRTANESSCQPIASHSRQKTRRATPAARSRSGR